MKSDANDATRLVDEGPLGLHIRLTDAQVKTQAKPIPMDSVLAFSGSGQSKSISSFGSPAELTFGVEFQTAALGCADGTRCNLVSVQDVLTLEYDKQASTLRCVLPLDPNNPLTLSFDASSQHLWAACWRSPTKAFLWVSGQPKIERAYQHAVFNGAKELILGGARTASDTTYFVGSLSYLRLWRAINTLQEIADRNQD